MFRISLLVTLLVVTSCLGQDQSVPRELDETVRELFIQPTLRETIELSPQQLAGIKSLIENKELSKLKNKVTFARFSHEAATKDKKVKSAKRLQDAEDAFRVAYRNELEKVLQSEQINALIPASMRLEFSTGVSPFRSYKVRQYCEISNELFTEIEPQMRKAESAIDQQFIAAQFKHAQEVLSSLPDESKKLFVRYAGNKYLPATEEDTSVVFTDIPYSGRVPTVTSIRLVVENPQLARECGITPPQVVKLDTLYSESSEEISKAFDTSNPGVETQFSTLKRRAFLKMREVLSDDQFSRVAKNRASIEFTADFAGPFERGEFVKFLKLSPEASRLILQKAMVERSKLKLSYDSINRSVFDELAALLPKVQHDKVHSLFDEVWKR